MGARVSALADSGIVGAALRLCLDDLYLIVEIGEGFFSFAQGLCGLARCHPPGLNIHTNVV